MHYFDGSDWGGWWVFMGLMMLAFWVLVAAVLVWLARRSGWGSPGGMPPAAPPPEEVLAQRLARGELDVEEYERRLEALGRHRPPGSPVA